MQKLLKDSDIVKLKNDFFEKEMEKKDVAKKYGYSSISALTLGLKAIGYKTVLTLKKIKN